MRAVAMPDGGAMPVMGLGTWHMGEDSRMAAAEVRAVQEAIARGISLIDTAEIYGHGGAEHIVGEALRGLPRERAFLVSKVAPNHASFEGTRQACAGTLKRLGTGYLDLYLLHWRGNIPLSETIRAFELLKAEGKIRAWGVSNFDVQDMKDIPDGAECAANQVLYNPCSRGIEFDLLAYAAERSVPVMAYTPLGQGGQLLDHPVITTIAARHGATAAQIALAWGLRQPGVVSIPKTTRIERIEENLGALDITLLPEDLAEIDRAFPPPQGKQRLEMI